MSETEGVPQEQYEIDCESGKMQVAVSKERLGSFGGRNIDIEGTTIQHTRFRSLVQLGYFNMEEAERIYNDVAMKLVEEKQRQGEQPTYAALLGPTIEAPEMHHIMDMFPFIRFTLDWSMRSLPGKGIKQLETHVKKGSAFYDLLKERNFQEVAISRRQPEMTLMRLRFPE